MATKPPRQPQATPKEPQPDPAPEVEPDEVVEGGAEKVAARAKAGKAKAGEEEPKAMAEKVEELSKQLRESLEQVEEEAEVQEMPIPPEAIAGRKALETYDRLRSVAKQIEKDMDDLMGFTKPLLREKQSNPYYKAVLRTIDQYSYWAEGFEDILDQLYPIIEASDAVRQARALKQAERKQFKGDADVFKPQPKKQAATGKKPVSKTQAKKAGSQRVVPMAQRRQQQRQQGKQQPVKAAGSDK